MRHHLFFLDKIHDFHLHVGFRLLDEIFCGQVSSAQLVSTEFTDALLSGGRGSQDNDLWY